MPRVGAGTLSRTAAGIAALLVVALLPGASASTRERSADQEPAVEPVASAADQGAAVIAARAQKSPVRVDGLTTESRLVHAQPNGSLTATLSPGIARVKQGKSWLDVDTTLARRTDGSVGPKVAATELALSGGGATAPLVQFGKGAQRLALSWPGPLPAPKLDGPVATYAEVLPGVDLKVRADVDGYVQHLVIKDARAAKNPAVGKIRLGLATTGVTLKASKRGGVDAVDAAGKVVFTAPPSAMWDAKGAEAAKGGRKLAEPGLGARRSTAKMLVEPRAVTLVPDRALLSDPKAAFPIVVDPDWHTPGRIGWAKVFSGYPNQPYWNGGIDGGESKAGLCYPSAACNGIGVAWSYFQYDTGFLGGKQILSASLNTTVTRSPSCGWRNHQLFIANGTVGGGTTWNNRPQGGHLDTKGVDVVYSGCDGYKGLGFNVGGNIRGGGISTYFIKAENEGDGLAWRKFDPNATNLVVNFNSRPNPPYEYTTEPRLPAPCKWCGDRPWIGDSSIRLLTKLSDPDPGELLRPVWNIYTSNQADEHRDWGPHQGSGAWFSTDVALDQRNGQEVNWFVMGSDGHWDSEWRNGPGPFRVDRDAPALQPNVSGLLYREDNRWHGGVGVPDTFTFDSNTVTDIDHFEYGWDDSTKERVDADALGGKASVTLTPPGDGPRDLFVRSVDRAGHKSPVRQHHFYVRAGNGSLAQWSFDGNAKDDAFLGDRDGTVNGNASYVPGAVGSAIRLDGQQGTYVTAPNTVRTNTSFSVSAWVKPDVIPAGQVMGVVAQEGTKADSFFLNARGDTNKWTFMVANADTDDPSSYWAVSPTAPEAGKWTHLTGVYDRAASKIRLYVNGVRVSETALAPGFVPFNAEGKVSIGREKWNGQVGNSWNGAIDEVQIHDRVLSDAEVRTAVGRDNVQAGFWKFDEEDGTTARNETAGGDMMVLGKGASFTGRTGGVVGGGVRLDGVDDYAATSGPVVRTDQSFAVAAWVKLDPAADRTQAFTAVSQDGTEVSGFLLQYRPENGGKWQFLFPSADKTDAQNQEFVFADGNAASDTWTHLAGVYDKSAKQIRIYVNGELKGTAARNNGFDAAGSLVVGRGRWQSEARAFWRGSVDEVRAYSRELSEAEISGIVARGNVTLGAWKLDGNAADTNNALAGTLQGSVDWAGGQSSVPDPTDLAVRLNGTDAHVSVGHAINVDQTFSVTAWAKLDKVGGLPAVVSQDGGQISAFKLRATPEGRWSFIMFGGDSSGATRDEVIGTAVQVGAWTHLVASYDASGRQLSLYVNGVLAGTKAHTQSWNHATGGLQIGRAKWDGQPVEYFRGAIDDVAAYSRLLFADEIKTMAGRDLTLVHNWRLDEASGTNAADAVGDRGATLTGSAAYAPGRAGNAIQLDGVDDTIGTSGVDIRTDQAFTVSAWVYLDRKSEPISQFTAVSLDGTKTSKFRLGHVADDMQNYCLDGVYEDPDKCGAWIFEAPNADGNAPPLKAAVSTLPAEITRWVHLVGVYDQASNKIWLYVDGGRVGDGTVDNHWPASGGLQIGRAKLDGVPAQYWPGRVDDVRLYTGALDKDRISTLHASYPALGGTPDLPTTTAGHWKFDEFTGTAVADSSGNNRNATLKGGAGWIGGRTGTAAWLDGSSGYAETAGPVLNTSQSFSAAAWVYMSKSNDGNRTVFGQDGSRVSTFLLQYNAAAGRWAVVVPSADKDSPTSTVLTSSIAAAQDDWTHLAVVYDVGLRQLRLYVNGLLSAAQVGVTVLNSAGPFSMGRSKWNGVNVDFFPRGVDDVRVYGKALQDGEIRRIHDDVGAPTFNAWRFDDGTGHDYAWRKNDAVLSGGTTVTDGVSGKALQFDGVSGAAAAGSFGVTMRDSFTVAAWARLSRGDKVATVVGQDGARMSGFALQYRPDSKRWVFGAAAEDADSAPIAYAGSLQPAALNQWTHLTGVYDYSARQLRLYVNGKLHGSRNNVTLWTTFGKMSIGRGIYNGKPAEYFPGAIDEVYTSQGMVADDEIARRGGWPTPARSQLGRLVNAAGDHRTASTSDPIPEGYHFEGTLGTLVGSAQPNTKVLYGCRYGNDAFTSTDPACEGQVVLGAIGRVYTKQPTNLATIPIYRCNTGPDHFESREAGCEGAPQEFLLGYTLAYAPLARHYNALVGDHWTTVYGTSPGYKNEGTLGLLPLTAQPGTQALMSCLDGTDEFASLDANCDGKRVLAKLGYLWTAAPAGVPSVPIYGCLVNGQRFVSRSATCEGQPVDRLLGYLAVGVPADEPIFPAAVAPQAAKAPEAAKAPDAATAPKADPAAGDDAAAPDPSPTPLVTRVPATTPTVSPSLRAGA